MKQLVITSTFLMSYPMPPTYPDCSVSLWQTPLVTVRCIHSDL